MPAAPRFDPRLLGGLSPERFLARHWQREPLLIRGAFPTVPSLPDRADLFRLAARDDVESRLVTSFKGSWTLAHGPIARAPRQKRDWTLLVQGVNLHDPAADALMRRFDFVPAWRLDDLMISYAVDGGSVGAHVDSYDVFLLQVEGQRRWRWNCRPAPEPVLRTDVPLRLVQRFEPSDEALLGPGDMLYLPPHCAHEGVAVGDCTTASIGFRMPTWEDLSREFLLAMADRAGPAGRHRDPGRRPTRTPAAIDRDFVDAATRNIARIRFSGREVADFVGRYLSEPKPSVWFAPPDPLAKRAFATRAKRRGLVLDPGATLLYRGRRGFIAGESFDIPADGRRSVLQLADRRRLDGFAVDRALQSPAVGELLRSWWNNGWVCCPEEGADAD